MCPATPVKDQTRGYVIPIGGAEAKHKDPVILERFIELCGGEDARVLVIPTASLLDETGPLYQDLFEGLGAKAMYVTLFSGVVLMIIDPIMIMEFHGGDADRFICFYRLLVRSVSSANPSRIDSENL